MSAGTPPPSDPIDRTDMDVVCRFVDNKLIGAVMLAKHAVRTLRTGGSMTFTSGINKDRPPIPGGSVVSAIAGSFSYFARALALELVPTRINVVSPGWVDTPMWDELVGEAKSGFFEGMAVRLPVRKIATPADIAPAYVYLMESDFTTGETIHIDGGQRLIYLAAISSGTKDPLDRHPINSFTVIKGSFEEQCCLETRPVVDSLKLSLN